MVRRFNVDGTACSGLDLARVFDGICESIVSNRSKSITAVLWQSANSMVENGSPPGSD